MAKVSFTTEEIGAIKELQDKYNVLGIQLVQLRLSKLDLANQQRALEQQEAELDQQIAATNYAERELAKQFDSRYGAGTLDLDSGEFTSKS